jgi:hypothetical protein
MPLAIRLKRLSARKSLIGYHVLVPVQVASVTPSFGFGVAAELER